MEGGGGRAALSAGLLMRSGKGNVCDTADMNIYLHMSKDEY